MSIKLMSVVIAVYFFANAASHGKGESPGGCGYQGSFLGTLLWLVAEILREHIHHDASQR